MYAVLQLGYVIYGTGLTKADAMADAKEWVNSPETLEDELVDLSNAVDGDLVCVECTRSLHEAVQEQGGLLDWDVVDGVARRTGEEVDALD